MATVAFDVLVVGAGPAGVSAAIELASGGASVLLIEQRSTIGGAIHRSRFDGEVSTVSTPERHKRAWSGLKQELLRYSQQIRLMTEAVFLGVDGEGLCVIDHRLANQVKVVRPKAIVYATGASEQVPHAKGWNLPGVVTAGGVQVQIKETGIAPKGRLIIAGSGPLPLALGAQLAKLGNPPAAILEPASPFGNLLKHPLAVLGLVWGVPQVVEGMGYLRTISRAGTKYHTSTTLDEVKALEKGLLVTTKGTKGPDKQYHADFLIIHDGLVPNDHGIPKADLHGLLVERAGDCNKVLGADAAIVDGRRVAHRVIARLRGDSVGTFNLPLHAAKIFQKSLSLLFQKNNAEIQEDAIVCRCEGVLKKDLEKTSFPSSRELKLISRVGMGPCQGRFCSKTARTIAFGEGHGAPQNEIDESGNRWPIRPVSVEALAKVSDI